MLTLGVVAAGVATGGVTLADGPVKLEPTAAKATASIASNVALSDRGLRLDRSANRGASAVVRDRIATPVLTRWATADLDVRTRPKADAVVVGTISDGDKVLLTGVERDGYAQLEFDSRLRWVTSSYLVDQKPSATKDPASMGLATTPCAGTSGVMAGLKPAAVRVYEAVCNNFPEITRYLGVAGRPEHNTGSAIDMMTSDPALGYRITAFLQAHAAELDLYDIIYRQHIWTPVRAGEGWRSMPNRGSATANHMDHVHVAVN